MRRALIALLLTLPGGLARAGDFSGAYAGVNAGYAFGRDRNAVSGSVPSESRVAGLDLGLSGYESLITPVAGKPNLMFGAGWVGVTKDNMSQYNF